MANSGSSSTRFLISSSIPKLMIAMWSHLCALLDEILADLLLSAEGCPFEGGAVPDDVPPVEEMLPVVQLSLDLFEVADDRRREDVVPCAVTEKNLDLPRVPVVDGGVERRVTVDARQVGIGPRLEKDLNGLPRPFPTREHQRCPIAAVRVNVRAVLDQQAEEIAMRVGRKVYGTYRFPLCRVSPGCSPSPVALDGGVASHVGVR